MSFNIGAFLGGLLRHALTTGGGVLVGNGMLSDGEVQTGVGAVMALFGLGLSMWDKRDR